MQIVNIKYEKIGFKAGKRKERKKESDNNRVNSCGYNGAKRDWIWIKI